MRITDVEVSRGGDDRWSSRLPKAETQDRWKEPQRPHFSIPTLGPSEYALRLLASRGIREGFLNKSPPTAPSTGGRGPCKVEEAEDARSDSTYPASYCPSRG